MTDHPRPVHDPQDTQLSAIMSERRHLINLAYRFLGSVAEAEDAVQETYTRWYAMPRAKQDDIANPAAWLTTVTSRICLDLLGSARARRENYVGEWLPEPLPGHGEWVSGRPGGADVDPADRITLAESVEMAFLVALESLTPAQRVAMILHDVFAYSFADVAEITGRTPAACRELASTARRRIRDARTPAVPASGRARVVHDFKRAWEARDIDALIELLDPTATATADGGGNAVTFPETIFGAEQVALAWLEIAGRKPVDMTFAEHTVNGQPGMIARQGGAIVTVFAFEISDDRITHIWVVRNPDKLRGFNR